MMPNKSQSHFISKISILITICFLCSCEQLVSSATPSAKTNKKDITVEEWQEKSKASKIKGWNYVADKLIAAKIPKNRVIAIFSDSKMPAWTPIPFKVKPQESRAIYSNLNNVSSRKNALEFYRVNKSYFLAAEKSFNVPAEYILSILQIETQCGKNTGDEPIFYWLARLVSAGFEPNLKYNLDNSEETPAPMLKELEERASWLEEEFFPHLLALIEMASNLGISPIEVKGSKGGALGFPQFLPNNISKYGIDGDKNGSINIFSAGDAIHSIANFLVAHGWKNEQNKEEILSYILEYNRSTAYANTVFEMAQILKKDIK